VLGTWANLTTRLSHRAWLTLRSFMLHDCSFRTICLLAVVTVLNFFDLALTQSQLPRGNFAEANAMAVTLSQCDPVGMVAFKSFFFAVGAAILYRLRHRWQSQVGLWLVAGCHVALMVWWVVYLDTIEICLHDPAVVACVAPY
jgi:hypothetical protein